MFNGASIGYDFEPSLLLTLTTYSVTVGYVSLVHDTLTVPGISGVSSVNKGGCSEDPIIIIGSDGPEDMLPNKLTDSTVIVYSTSGISISKFTQVFSRCVKSIEPSIEFI